MEERLKETLSSFEPRDDQLIPVLQEVQEELGYLPDEAMLEISRFLRIPESRVYAVATFFAQFRFTPVGKYHVMVCRGTACHVRGSPRIRGEIEKRLGIAEDETTPDMLFSLETVACIGACGLAPTLVVNKDTHGRMTVKKVSEIFDEIRSIDGEGQDE